MASSSRNFVDLNKVVEDWAWRQYDRTASRKQASLHDKERRKGKKYIDVQIDWSAVRFRDETQWIRVADDANDDQSGPGLSSTQAAMKSRPADSGAPQASVLFQTKFTNNTGDPQEYTMRTEKTTRSSLITAVESGYTKGFELGVKLTTPGEIFEANAGYRREFTLTNSEGETFEEELTWGLESKISVKPHHVAEARLVVDEKKQAGEFVVRSRISGMIYVSFTAIKDNNSLVKSTGEDVATILKEYRQKEVSKGRTMDFLTLNSAEDEVTIETRGQCKFRYGIKQEARVDQTQINSK